MKRLSLPLALIIIIALALLDHLTGYEISFSIFYLIPILMVARFDETKHAIIIAVISAIAWLVADTTAGHHYSHFLIPLWNMFMRMTVFMIITILLGKTKKELEVEKKLSQIDTLTELNNAKSFIEQAKIEKGRSLRFKRPFTIAYIDIDNFKQLNDVFGHGKGDLLLRDLGKIIKENIRTYDIAARLGGDEFTILFPETGKEHAQGAVNKIKSCVEKMLRKYLDSLTLSIGVLTVTNPDYPIDGVIKIADDLMYSVKKNSKNGIEYDTLD